MRVFLCSFRDFSVAIPMHSVSSLALHDENTTLEEGANYISFPRLFNLPIDNIRHRIILKNYNDDENEIAENRTVLFIPEVECETEISIEKLHPVPKALSGTRFSLFFEGIQFNSRPELALSKPVLLLKSENLIKSDHKETIL